MSEGADSYSPARAPRQLRQRALTAAIERFTRDTREYNAGPTPFGWVETAGRILAKAVCKPQHDSGAEHM